MALFARRAPAETRARLDPEERVLAWAETDTGGVVAATNRGLWWPMPEPRRISWALVDKAVWSEGVLAVTEADLVDDLLLVERRPVTLRLPTPREVPSVVRRRVETSVAHTREVNVSGGRARLVGRRMPGRDGLVWWARLAPGTADTADVRDELRATIARTADSGGGLS